MVNQKVKKFKITKAPKVEARQVLIALGQSAEAREVHSDLKKLAMDSGLTIGAIATQMLRFVLDQKSA